MFGFPCLKAVLTFDLDALTRLKQACVYKWCVQKSKKPDVQQLPKSRGKSAVKKGQGMKGMVERGKGTKLLVKKKGVEATVDKQEGANKGNVGKVVGGKAKKDIHPRQTRACTSGLDLRQELSLVELWPGDPLQSGERE